MYLLPFYRTNQPRDFMDDIAQGEAEFKCKIHLGENQGKKSEIGWKFWKIW